MRAHTSSALSGRVRVLLTRYFLSFCCVVLMYGGLQSRAVAQALYSFDLDWESTPAFVNVAAGQQAILSFGGAAGQIIQMDLINFFPWTFQVKNASNTVIWSASVTSSTSSVTISALPADGNYSLVLTPLSAGSQGLQYNAGAITSSASLVAGSPVAIHVGPAMPLGAYVRIPFSGTAGEYISVTTDNSSGWTGDALVYYLSGTSRVYVGRVGICCGGNSHDAVLVGPLPVTGTYYYMVRASSSFVTHGTMERKDPASFTLNGSPTALTWTTYKPQYLPIKFTGTSGQSATLKISTASCYGFSTSTYYTLIRPDLTISASGQATTTSSSLGVLPMSGQYLLELSHLSAMSGTFPQIAEQGSSPYSPVSTQSCTIQVTSP